MSVMRLDDIRLAIRRVRKDRGATIASVAALACGMGAAVATWSLLSAVLLKPLPVAAPERLFEVDVAGPPPNAAPSWVPTHSYPVFEAIRDSGTFDRVGAVGTGGLSMLVVEQGDVPQARQVYFAGHDFFATLGIGAARGRTFTDDEDRRGAPPAAVLSDHYWRTVFNSDPTVLGRELTVSGTPVTVVGVLPHGFRGLHLSEAPDLYLPLQVFGDFDHPFFPTADPFGPGAFWIRIVGRLRPGETRAAAAARLNALDCMCGRGLTNGEVRPLLLTSVNTAAVPEAVRAGMAQFATLLSATVGLLLLAGSLTVGMLLLVRTEDRSDELAVRLALGATRWRLAVSIAIEAAILCTLGAALAVPVALWFSYGVRAFQLPGRIAIERLELTLDPGFWLTVTGAALASTCVIVLLACMMGIAAAARSPMQSRALAAPRVTRRTPRTALVAAQFAISLVLVTGAGLLARSLIEALSLNPGVQTDRIVTAGINLGQYGYTPARATTFVEELRERLRRNRAVESVSIRHGASGAAAGVPVVVDGVRHTLPSFLTYMRVDDDYFSTLGLPIVTGRSFAGTGNLPGVAVVSESLGRLIADGGNPIGHRISDSTSFRKIFRGEAPSYLEVIGVVPDLILDVSTTEPLVVYQPAPRDASQEQTSSTLVLRAARDPNAAMREAMATARALDPRVSLDGITTLDGQIERQMGPQRFGIYILGALGGIALLLTMLGTYVMAESMVVRRRRELGIRAALGAGSAQLRRLVLRDTARLVGIGLAVGLVLSVLGARLIRSLLFHVRPLDPWVLGTVAAVIFGLALLVSLRPALEATRLDLTRSLREE